MSIRSQFVPVITLLCGVAFLLAACGAVPTAAPQVAATLVPPTMPPNQDSWILVDLPPNATQLDHGAEIYRLVCSACHAHSGEGLTDAWRATWDPQDQNCWQSKCHAANHPPDGFELPIAPAVVGRQALAPFQTAADLHAYIQATMPWQEPNSMTAEEGWAVTAYVIKLNRMNPPTLDHESAAQFRLHAEPAKPAATPPTTSPSPSGPSLRIAGAAALLIIALVLVIRIRKRAKASERT